MSYDIAVSVKVEGCGAYASIAYPEYDSPTYNLCTMFRACMDWDFTQGEKYKCDFALERINCGINELLSNRKEYEQYNPPNGWGDIDSAIRDLKSARDCIIDCAENIPLNCLYFSW